MWRRSGLLGIFVSLVLLVSLAVPVAADPIPHSFYGTLTIGGSPALPGTELTAVVEGGGGSYTTTVLGQYGSATDQFDKLVVSGDIEVDALIEFYADGAKADQTANFRQGRPSNLNLTVPAAETFTITATAGAGGSISPSGDVVVNSGADQAFTITPDTGYAVADVLVDDVSVGAVTSYLFENVTADHTIHATFVLVVETFTINAAAGTGGAISPAGAVVVESGADQAFTITADTGYLVADVLVDDVSVGAVTSYNFTNVTADHTIYASFVPGVPPETFTITATAGAGGAIEPSGDVVVESGADQAFTVTADPGYDVADVLVDDVSVGAVTSYLFENVTADHTIHASFVFVIETFTITATAGAGGSISPAGDMVVESGADQAFTVTADPGYDVADVLVDDVSVGAVTSYLFENVTADHTIHATFVFVIETFTITATAGVGGSISPSGDVVVESGADQAFAITADLGYDVADVLVDDVSVGAVTSYLFENVTAAHTIHATFISAVLMEIELVAGWNTFSTPIALDPRCDKWGEFRTISGILQDPGEIAYYFDSSQDPPWILVTAVAPLEPLEGFYVYLLSEGTANIIPNPGNTSPPTRVLLGEDVLYLVGLASLEDMDVHIALGTYLHEVAHGFPGYSGVISPGINYPDDWGYSRYYQDPPYVYVPEDYMIRVGTAVWVAMLNDGTLVGWTETPIS